MPCKKWFDDSYKTARKHLKGLTGDAYQHAAKKYHALLRKKKREYILQKESSDAQDMARNPKKFWNEIDAFKEEVSGNFTKDDMLMYVQALYNIPRAQEMLQDMHDFNEDKECFSL